jgi:hypothetical protein
MRERAEKATPGPWRDDPDGYGESQVLQVRDDLAGGRFNRIARLDGWNEESEDGADENNAAHIASWHPAVALAVADWLDVTADVAEEAPGLFPYEALAVVRAYLGSAS